MKKAEILIVSGSSDNTTTLTSIHTNSDWNKTHVFTDEDAIEKFNYQNFDVVLIDNDLSETGHNKLRAIFGVLDPKVIILNFNNGTKNAADDINKALKNRDQKNKAYVINDDVFKGYRMN